MPITNTSPSVWLLIGFLLIGGVLLFTEHRAHVVGALIYMPLLLCLLIAYAFLHARKAPRSSPQRWIGERHGGYSVLRIMGFGADQLCRLHAIRLQLFQAANEARLAIVLAFSAFLVALFAEMYGFPVSIYFLSGWLQSKYPGIDWFSHDAGHLLEMMFG
jgi:methanethiol S-methyltransferase